MVKMACSVLQQYFGQRYPILSDIIVFMYNVLSNTVKFYVQETLQYDVQSCLILSCQQVRLPSLNPFKAVARFGNFCQVGLPPDG